MRIHAKPHQNIPFHYTICFSFILHILVCVKKILDNFVLAQYDSNVQNKIMPKEIYIIKRKTKKTFFFLCCHDHVFIHLFCSVLPILYTYICIQAYIVANSHDRHYDLRKNISNFACLTQNKCIPILFSRLFLAFSSILKSGTKLIAIKEKNPIMLLLF